VRYSKTMALPGCLVIEAERGWVTLADTEDAEIQFRTHENPDLFHSLRDASVFGAANVSGFDLQMQAFAAACLNGTEFPIPVRQAVDSLELIENLYGCRQPLVDDWYGKER
jgi:predicted dehydrogenase